LNVNNYKADPEKEKQFYKSLVLAYEAFLSETGKIPTCMPVATPNFPVEPYHLKAIARIIKDPRLGKGIETFSATAWPNLKQLGLKWILNALHHNPSVRTLRIARGGFELDDDNRLIRFIQSSPHVTSIKLPNLTACGNAGDLILRALLREMASNSTILNLDLESVTYSEVTFGMLLTMLSTNTTLQKLNLRFTDFSYHNRAQRFMQALIDNPGTALRRIKFPLMRGAVLWTAQMLEYNQSLTNIDLSHIALGSHAALLKRALEMNTQLQILNVASTQLTDTDLAHLLEPLWTNSTLTHLDLSSNSMLSNDSARNIGDMLMQNTGIQTLILDSLHGIGKDKLAKRLALALRVNSSVHHLSIQSSSTDSAGIAALSEALVINHGLHELKLSHNPINDDSIATLVKGLKPNFGVHSLWIEQCKFGDSAVKALVPWLKTTNVLTKRLNLGSNRISEASYSFLREAIHSNPALKNLILGSVSVQKSLIERLTALRSDVSALFQSS
jgi:Ran GTPase-activating protein (RanGAP) involved in mRNA processing and transport